MFLSKIDTLCNVDKICDHFHEFEFLLNEINQSYANLFKVLSEKDQSSAIFCNFILRLLKLHLTQTFYNQALNDFKIKKDEIDNFLTSKYDLFSDMNPLHYKNLTLSEFLSQSLYFKVSKEGFSEVLSLKKFSETNIFEELYQVLKTSFFLSFNKGSYFEKSLNVFATLEDFKVQIFKISYEAMIIKLDQEYSQKLNPSIFKKAICFPSCEYFYIVLTNLILCGELLLPDHCRGWEMILSEKQNAFYALSESEMFNLVFKFNLSSDAIQVLINSYYSNTSYLYDEDISQSLINELNYFKIHKIYLFNFLVTKVSLNNATSVLEVLNSSLYALYSSMQSNPHIIFDVVSDKDLRHVFKDNFKHEYFDYSRVIKPTLSVDIKTFINIIFHFNQKKMNIDSLMAIYNLFDNFCENSYFLEFIKVASLKCEGSNSHISKLTSFFKKINITLKRLGSHNQEVIFFRLRDLLDESNSFDEAMIILNQELTSLNLDYYTNPYLDVNRLIKVTDLEHDIQNQVINVFRSLDEPSGGEIYQKCLYDSILSDHSSNFLSYKFKDTDFCLDLINQPPYMYSSFRFSFADSFKDYFTIGDHPVKTCLTAFEGGLSNHLMSVVAEPNIAIMYMYKERELIARRLLFQAFTGSGPVVIAAPIYSKYKSLNVYESFDFSLIDLFRNLNQNLFIQSPFEEMRGGSGSFFKKKPKRTMNFSLNLTYSRVCKFDFLPSVRQAVFNYYTKQFSLEFKSLGYSFKSKN